MMISISHLAFADGDTIRNYKSKKDLYPAQPVLIKTSPTALLWGGIFPFTSEYRIMIAIPSSKLQSEQIGFSYLGKNVFLSAFEKSSKQASNFAFKVSGWRFQYAHKFYFGNRGHEAPYGLYIAPSFSYSNAHVSIGLNRYYHQTYFDFRHVNGNIILGIQTGRSSRMKIDIDGGFGYKTNNVFYHASAYRIFKYDTSDFGDFYNGHLSLVFDINIGYFF